MYTTHDKEVALDLWFEMAGEISVNDFVAELGWPGS